MYVLIDFSDPWTVIGPFVNLRAAQDFRSTQMDQNKTAPYVAVLVTPLDHAPDMKPKLDRTDVLDKA
jgi:hypothetical protein